MKETTHPGDTGDFELCVRALIKINNKILVIREKKNSHLFLPGGHVEFGERAITALKREIKEELGVEMLKAEFIGTVENIYNDNGKHHELNLVFAVKVDKIISKCLENHVECVKLSINEFKSNKILPFALQKPLLKWFKNKKRFWSSQIYEKTIC